MKTNIFIKEAIDPEDDVWSSDGVLPAKQDSAVYPAPARPSGLVQPQVGMYQLVSPGMYAQPLATVHSATTAEMDIDYIFSDTPVDVKTPMNALRAWIAEYYLITHGEFPSERARFFPTVTDNTDCKGSNGWPSLEFDDLFDLPAKRGMFKGHPAYSGIEALTSLTTPCLRMAASYDLRTPLYDEQAMLDKARQILTAAGINADNPYTVNVDAMTNLEGRYRLGLYASRPFGGEAIIHNTAGQAFACKQVQDRMAYIPLRSITRFDTAYIHPAVLPYPCYHLIGARKLEWTDVKTIVVTPDPTEVLLNAGNESIAVLSWVGGDYTLEATDWSRLQGKGFVYALNPGSFGGDDGMAARVCAKVCSFLCEKGAFWQGTVRRSPNSAHRKFILPNSTVSVTFPPGANNYEGLVEFPQQPTGLNPYGEYNK